MAARLFSDIYRDAVNRGLVQSKSKDSLKALAGYARKIQRDPNQIMKGDGGQLLSNERNIGVGKMYLYFYDPKWKAKLPYYDEFPCVIPMNFYDDGFLGLNLHYLPYAERAILLNALYEVESNHKLDERKKFNISYGKILSNFGKFKRAKPCIKRYLYKHMKSRPLRVHYKNWPLMAFLPVQRFQKATQQKVWADSRRIMRG